VLTSSRYKRALDRSKEKEKKRIQMKIQLSQVTEADETDGTPVGFAPCVTGALKRI
jgi:hypothetical protein